MTFLAEKGSGNWRIGLVLVGLVCLNISSTVHAQSYWQSLAPFPVSPRGIVGIAARGKIYMLAGLQGTNVPLGLVYEYDPGKNMWAAKKPMPLPAHHIAVTETNGKIYIFGGFKKPASGQDGWEIIDNSWEFDPAGDTWKALKPMPSERGAAAAAAVNGKIYVMGGAALHPGMKKVPLVGSPEVTRHRTVDTVQEYDIASNSWRECVTMPTGRNHFVLEPVDGTLYAIGGRTGSVFFESGSETNGVEEYDPTKDEWGPARLRMSTPRSSMSGGAYKGRIYVIGGGTREATLSIHTSRVVEAYEPATNLWFVLPLVPFGRAPVTGAINGDLFYLLSASDTAGEKDTRKESGYPFDALHLDSLK